MNKTKKRRRILRIKSYVWCDNWAEVHVTSLDPYSMSAEFHCDERDHRPLYTPAIDEDERSGF